MAEDIFDGKALPFSRPFAVARASSAPFELHVETDGDERAAAAGFLGVDAVESLSADLTISPWRRDGIRVKGTVSAAVVQSCVITLDPLRAEIEEEVDATFLPETSRHFRRKLNAEGELIVDPDGPDEPEPFTGTEVDMAGLVMEAVGLAIDPYPRKPGAELPQDLSAEDESAEEAPQSPFAALKNWKGENE